MISRDDMLDDPAFADSQLWQGDAALPDPQTAPIAVNVYLGARSIADAIKAGAQVVVTGRVADPALALGPLVAHFGWDWDDLNRIAAGTLIGHLLECGSQVSGGYIADPGTDKGASVVLCCLLPDMAAMYVVIEDALESGLNSALCLNCHGKSVTFLPLDLDITPPPGHREQAG